jgi:hypothetical protein
MTRRWHPLHRLDQFLAGVEVGIEEFRKLGGIRVRNVLLRSARVVAYCPSVRLSVRARTYLCPERLEIKVDGVWHGEDVGGEG